MKKLVILAMAVVALAGCSTSVKESTSNAAPQQFVQPQISQDEVYLQKLHSLNNRILDSAQDGDLIVLGKKVCSVLDSGVTVSQLASAILNGFVSDGVTDPAAYQAGGAIVGAAVSVYCPQYTDQVQRYLASNNTGV